MVFLELRGNCFVVIMGLDKRTRGQRGRARPATTEDVLETFMVGSGDEMTGLFRACRWATKVKVIVGPGLQPCGLSSFAYINAQ